MVIKRVWSEEGCTICNLCEEICPEVFKVEDEAFVNEGINYSDYENQIIEAAENCPVDVIKYE